jgi:hypothetical protein
MLPLVLLTLRPAFRLIHEPPLVSESAGCGYGSNMPPSKVLILVLGLIVAVAVIYAVVWNQAQ